MTVTRPWLGEGAWPHVSASQIETYEACARKWAHHYLDGEPRQETQATADGKLGHLYMEAFLLHGQLPNASAVDQKFLAQCQAQGTSIPDGPTCKIARTARGMLTRLRLAPGTPGIQIEAFWALTKQANGGPTGKFPVRVLGYKDVRLPRGNDGRPSVIDHKFTGHMQWAKEGEYLATQDAQGVLYAAHEMVETKAEEVHLVWNYGVKGSTKGELRHGIATRQGIQERLRTVWGTAAEIVALKTFAAPAPVPDPNGKPRRALALAPNSNTCSAFGGCPYRELCHDVSAGLDVEQYFATHGV